MTEFTVKERTSLAKEHEAMPDGKYPIRNIRDLKHAIQSYGRASDPEAVKRWIIKRARQLQATDLLPDEWRSEFAHYGVKGMKWGVRKKRQTSGRTRYTKESKDYARSAELSKKPINEMSNEELVFLNNRYNLERQYKSFNPKKESAGKRFVKSKAGKMVIGTLSTAAVAVGIALVKDRVGEENIRGFGGFVPGGDRLVNLGLRNADFIKSRADMIKENHRQFHAAKKAAKKAASRASTAISRRMIGS